MYEKKIHQSLSPYMTVSRLLTIMPLSILLLSCLAHRAWPANLGCQGMRDLALLVSSFFTAFSSSLNIRFTSTFFLSMVLLMA